MNNIKRKAFTIIEVLVCVCIIGILAALIVPAIQQYRGNNQGVMAATGKTANIEYDWANGGGQLKVKTVDHDGHKFVVFWNAVGLSAVEVKDKAEKE